MTQQELGQLLNALHKQQQLLEKIASSLDKPKLGFHNDVGTTYVYANRHNGGDCLWYTLNGDRQPQAIKETAITGYLRGLKFEQVERRGKPTHKLLVTIQADRLYVIESGYETLFAKGILGAISTLQPAQLLQPITISVRPGEEDSVLFSSVWVAGILIKRIDDNPDWREISLCAIAVVKQAVELAAQMPF